MFSAGGKCVCGGGGGGGSAVHLPTHRGLVKRKWAGGGGGKEVGSSGSRGALLIDPTSRACECQRLAINLVSGD